MASDLVQFAGFELDRGAYQLRRKGRVLRLQRIPFDLLLLLVERPGQLVTRDEIREWIWGKEVFLDSDSSINTAVRKLRRALHDHPGSPRFIATVPAKGYRFIGELSEPASQIVLSSDSPSVFPDAESKAGPPRSGSTGERRRLTVLFCDLMNSPALTAQGNQEEWWAAIADRHRAAVQAIERYGGRAGPYRGDGVMAYFGWPEAHDNNAEHAVRAGLAILEAVSVLNQPAPARLRIRPRIGIDSGAVLIGPGTGQEANVFGDTPNIAVHAQAAGAPGTLLITAATLRLVVGLFAVEDHGAKVVNGLERPIHLYRVIKPTSARGRLEAAAARGLTPFVGREEELRLLMNRWEWGLEGEGQVALITGEPGIGKSRLMRRFNEQIAGTPHNWVQGVASAFFQFAPFYAIGQLLRELLASRSAESAGHQLTQLETALASAGLKSAETVALIAPLLNLSLPAKHQSSQSPENLRRRLLGTLAAWLLHAAGPNPLVIAIEDLHWADPSTLDLLLLLADQAATARLLLLLTARPEFHAQRQSRAHHTQIMLSRLNVRDTRAMVERVAAQKPFSEAAIAAVIKRASGVPLFVEELTRTVLEDGDARLTERAIPATLHDSLMARLDRLGSARELLQLGAVIGSEFSYELLRAVHPDAEDALQCDLHKLTGAELLYSRGLPPNADYQFKHALIRDAAYEALLKDRRKELHLQVARAIDERFLALKKDHPEVLARHWSEAGELELAIAAWNRAGKIAVARNAFHEALESYRQALALLELQPESPERDSREMELRQSIYSMLSITKGYAAPETIQAVETSTTLAEKVGDLGQLFNLLTSLGSTHLIAGDYLGSSAILDRALELTVRHSIPVSLAYLHVLQTIVRYCRGDLEGAEKHFSAWFELFCQPGAVPSIPIAVNAFAFGGLNAWLRGLADTARERERQMIATASQGSPFDVANSKYCGGRLVLNLRDYARAETLATSAVELAEKHQFPNPAVRGRGILGLARAHLRSTAEGIGLIQQCLAGMREIGTRMAITSTLSDLAEAQGLEGHVGEALETIELTLRGFPVERFHRPETLRLRGELRLKKGQPHLAEVDFRDAIVLAQSMSARAWELRSAMSLARLLRDTGRREEACTMLSRIYNWFTEGFDTPDLKDAKALLDGLD
jgi:class 3 adenylate cyclase/tetratricopeptide (TPR) repeat protein